MSTPVSIAIPDYPAPQPATPMASSLRSGPPQMEAPGGGHAAAEGSNGRRPRDSYRDVGESTRAVLQAAATAEPPLRPREWRVLSAVLQVTATWSRLQDRVTHEQLAPLCGLDKPTDRRDLARELRSLATRGLIVYEPGVSLPGERRRPSTVGLPPVEIHQVSDVSPPVEIHQVSEGSPPVDLDTDPRWSRLSPPVDLDTDSRCASTVLPRSTEAFPEKRSELSSFDLPSEVRDQPGSTSLVRLVDPSLNRQTGDPKHNQLFPRCDATPDCPYPAVDEGDRRKCLAHVPRSNAKGSPIQSPLIAVVRESEAPACEEDPPPPAPSCTSTVLSRNALSKGQLQGGPGCGPTHGVVV